MSVRVDPRLLPHLPRVAPGVAGWVEEFGGEYRLMFVAALEEGSGHVGRYLDGLSTERRVVVVTVTSDRLAGMLARRGFTEVGFDWVRERQ